jgi:hypothetical protein
MLRRTVLFEGTDASGHAGFWETNGTADGTYELTGVPNSVFSPADFTVFNNEVLFQGQDTSLLYGIWETNGNCGRNHGDRWLRQHRHPRGELERAPSELLRPRLHGV